MGYLFIFILLKLLWLCCTKSNNMEELISKANIYYQRPLHLGDPKELIMAEVEQLRSKKDIKVIIHGYTSSRTHNSIRPLGHAYMANGVDNVFLADWENAAAVDYPSSRQAVGPVAIHFAKILEDFISKHQIEHSDVHLLGHSLGAHIAGDMGKYFNGTLGRITGLDPALPLFAPHSPDALFASTAQFVDNIHTDFPVFGDITPRGTVDFYPHFGVTPQPGCGDFDLSTVNKLIFQSYSCSHSRAVFLYAESIRLPRNFPALPCSLVGIKLRSLQACLQLLEQNNVSQVAYAAAIANMDERVVVYMGENVTRAATGLFYLDTYDAPPFGMGVYSRF